MLTGCAAGTVVQFATSAAKLSSIGHKSNHTKPFSFLSLIKTRAEGVVESMGNYVELHADKRRGRMDISDIGVEAMIHWNGPPLAWALRGKSGQGVWWKGQVI